MVVACFHRRLLNIEKKARKILKFTGGSFFEDLLVRENVDVTHVSETSYIVFNTGISL